MGTKQNYSLRESQCNSQHTSYPVIKGGKKNQNKKETTLFGNQEVKSQTVFVSEDLVISTGSRALTGGLESAEGREHCTHWAVFYVLVSLMNLPN